MSNEDKPGLFQTFFYVKDAQNSSVLRQVALNLLVEIMPQGAIDRALPVLRHTAAKRSAERVLDPC
jgi:hypothetical protein